MWNKASEAVGRNATECASGGHHPWGGGRALREQRAHEVRVKWKERGSEEERLRGAGARAAWRGHEGVHMWLAGL